MKTETIQNIIYTHIHETGLVPNREQVATKLNITPESLNDAYAALAEARLLVLDSAGEAMMAIPFSATETPYPIYAGERRYWANCMWDALGIMAALDEDSRMETTCPDCGEALGLATENGQLKGDSGVVHFLVPANEWWDNITFT